MSSEHEPTETEFPLNDGEGVHEPDLSAEDGGGRQAASAEPASGEPSGEQPTGEQPSAQESQAVAELRDRWQRAMAELDNLRKRHARELERERSAERARTAAALLPLIDHLELALEHAGADESSVIEGVKAVRDEAVGTFEKLGFPRYAETGVPFDPTRHEAVGTVEDDGSGPGVVHEVVRPGYGDGVNQLRPAAVTVTAPRE